MNGLTIFTTLMAAIAPTVISITSLYLQQRTSKENNELQLQINRMNNEHQLKMKDVDLINSQKNASIYSYIDSLTQYINNPTHENLVNYQSSMAKVSMFVSKKVFSEIDDINNSIMNNDIESIKNSLLYSFAETINTNAENSN